MRFAPPRRFVSTFLVSALALICADAASAQEFAGRDKLFAHSNEFRQEVIQVADGVYVAVGFALAHVILVEGDDGLIIIDTHSHPDHVRGSRAFVGDVEPTEGGRPCRIVSAASEIQT